RPLQASDTFRALKGSDEQAVPGPIAQFETDVEAPDNPYPDGRLVNGDQVHIPDRFALRGLADTPDLAPARTLLRTTADAVGAAGLFSTTAPIRIALSGFLELATVNPNSVRFFARSDGSLALAPLLQQLQRRGISPRNVALAVSFPT